MIHKHYGFYITDMLKYRIYIITYIYYIYIYIYIIVILLILINNKYILYIYKIFHNVNTN